MNNSIRRMIDNLKADPARMIPAYKDAYPGITDDEALQLARYFIGLFSQPGQPGQSAHEHAKEDYAAALDAAAKKYPGGAFSSIEMPGLDLDL